MDRVLSHLTLNSGQFHELSMRNRVVLSQLPLSLTVLLIVTGSLLFHPLVLQDGLFRVGVALQVFILLLCILLPWHRLPYPSFLIIPLLDFLPIGLMRHGAGTEITGVGLLTVFPVIWLAASGLYPRRLLAVGFFAALAIVWTPVFLTGGEITASSLTQSLLLPFIMLGIAVTIRVMTASMMDQQRVVEEKDAELTKLLAESGRRERLLNTIVNSVDVGLLAVNETGDPVLTNRKLQQFQALAAEDGGTSHSEQDLLIYQQDGRSVLPAARRPSRRAADGQVFSDYLLWWGQQPNQRVLSTSSRLMTDQSGSREGSVVTFNDVTELVAALNAKDEFVSTVSHELRTPLTAIRGYLELLMAAPDVPEHVVAGLEVVSRNSDRLHKLVLDLLAAAEGSPDIRPAPTDFPALVSQRVASARERNQNPAVRFEEAGQQGITINCDPGRIAQVLDNLLSNAVKYSPSGGTVTVTVQSGEDGVECRIADQGTGMTAEEITGVFSKFFRTSAARNAAIPGVGLGLAISKAIVERHGGSLTCRSTAGEGSTFSFRLPVHP
ncbi:HAMP domain-containing sensor histidine kinase [Arthrobacter sp. Br18]|uniref:sensor histidine kinase n=1 Tax=Arthrobacter sp. Br18 TaxID=1312954 RepID=UPI0020A689E2|nr:HAMP domain-containing sensor histidine kinase [Arthrobacter sp. Br18]